MAETEMTPEQKKMASEALGNLSSLFGDEKLAAHLNERIRVFQGNFDSLESALGALVIGRVAGWRVLRLLHAPKTYRFYEGILDLDFQGVFPWSGEPVMPERGPYAKKSVALKITDTVGGYWDMVKTGDARKRVSEAFDGTLKDAISR